MNKPSIRICTRCVMDETDSSITFDNLGVCDHCRNFEKKIKPFWHTDNRGKEKIEKLGQKIKSKSQNKDFDCIIGISGGIDSSYLTYYVKKFLKLNPLVFHVDAGWNTQISVNNIQRLVEGLNLELYTEVINWEEMKDLQRAFFKSGVPHIDSPQDHAFFATMYKFANKYNIKHILTGGNFSTECIRNPLEWMYYQSDSRQLKHIHSIFGEKKLRSFPTTNIVWYKFWLPYIRGIKVYRPLNYIPYIKEEAKKVLIKELGWQPYKQKHFESRFTKFYESYWLPERFGYDVRKVQFSSLILTGQMTRKEALNELKNKSYDKNTIISEKEFIANKLDISLEELEDYMKMPKKTYKDYKNQEFIYNLGANILKTIGIEKGGKR